MKEHLIWFCGTGTSKEDMGTAGAGSPEVETVLKGQYYDYCLVIDGVGTAESAKQTIEMNGLGKYNPQRWFQASKEMIFGYEEANQLNSIDQTFAFFEKLKTVKKKQSVNLIIGGHSRGAAAGIVGFLCSLLAELKEDKQAKDSPFFQAVKTVTIVAVDPVAGPKGNDLMGIKNLNAKKQNLSDILNEIEEFGSRKGLFKVVLYAARFDVREEFKFDDLWYRFNENRGPFADRFFFYCAGFRHSSMIFQGDELSELYPPQQGPIHLLKTILMEAKKDEFGSGRQLTSQNLQKAIADKENALLQELVTKKNEYLEQHTEKGSYNQWYCFKFGKAIYKGDPLKKIIKAKNKDADPIVSNRRLKYQPT